ncbi:MAG TPA: flagellar hook-associated protein FlgK, partial [Polyangiales bacterium]|nr:flagellar hook-associated protein FlgK [Polyangiales bacterium]
REQDTYLEKRGLGAQAQSGDADAQVQTLAVTDTVFGTGDGSVGDALDAFESSLSDLASSPSSTAVRQVVLSNADSLSQAFHSASDSLTGARSDANSRIQGDISTLDTKVQQIGDLTGQIIKIKSVGGDAGDLEDKRDGLIRDISSIAPITTVAKDNGAVTVMLAGQRNLVDENGAVHLLSASADPTSGDVHVYRTTAGAQEDVTNLFTTGSVGGTISARDGALKTAQTSLDQLAFDVGNAYNAVQSAGVGLDGNTGRNLFTTQATATGAAASIGVSSDVDGHPEFLAAAQDATSLPGDNRNAIALLNVRDQNVASGGTATLQTAYSSLVSAAGTASQNATQASDQATTTLNQINALRDSVSGVSTDDEMISMMKYQRAYQASLRVIETADSMMSSLMDMTIGS